MTRRILVVYDLVNLEKLLFFVVELVNYVVPTKKLGFFSPAWDFIVFLDNDT